MKSRLLIAGVLVISGLGVGGLFLLKSPARAEDVTAGRMLHLCAFCGLYKQSLKTWPVNPAALKSISGFSTNLLVDAWGHPIALVPPANSLAPLRLVSYGADGRPGGSGSNEDIYVDCSP